MNVNPLRVVTAIAVWVLLMTAASGYYIWSWLNTPQPVKLPDSVYVIERGSSLHSVAQELNSHDLIRWPRVWVGYARILNLSNIKAGEYRLAQKESPVSLLARFQKGEQLQHQITLVEGRTLKEFLNTLHRHSKIQRTLENKTYDEILAELGLTIKHPEGYFFPDTYRFIRGDSDQGILLRAYLRMNEVLHQEWINRAEGLPYKSAYEALIMASIVEKETGAAFERKQIAGVFVRRLQKGMRLQTDPTVIYGMGDSYKGNIRKRDLKTPTPYNTYTNHGLPPTPIAMPGREAIHAALHPASGNTLYFVAKGDGTHQFSATLKEHEAAVTKFQKKRRSDYRSAPLKQEPVTEQSDSTTGESKE